MTDPQVEALGMIRSWPHPDIEDFRLVDHPLSYNGTRSFRQDAPPSLGQHSAAILTEAGYDEEAISAMFAAQRPPVPTPSGGEDYPA